MRFVVDKFLYDVRQRCVENPLAAMAAQYVLSVDMFELCELISHVCKQRGEQPESCFCHGREFGQHAEKVA